MLARRTPQRIGVPDLQDHIPPFLWQKCYKRRWSGGSALRVQQASSLGDMALPRVLFDYQP